MIRQDQAEHLLLYLILIVQKYGKGGVLTLENFRELLVGAPAAPYLYALSNGDDLVIHIEPSDGEVITPADLDKMEHALAPTKETIH